MLDAPGDDDNDVIFHQHGELFGVYDEESMADTPRNDVKGSPRPCFGGPHMRI